MENVTTIFGTHWFHRRFTLTPDGRYTTVTELAEWARQPYDQLRTNLLLEPAGAENATRTVLLAPVRHGDGTTTTAVLLGACLATTHRCLLLDLNFRRPGIAAAIGLEGTPGLAGLLRKGATDTAGLDLDVDRTIVPTRVPNLFALPTALDATQRLVPEIPMLAALMRYLRERFDYIVIDTAPVLQYPDTALFAGLADAVLLIMAADSTPVEIGIQARREIERSHTRVLGAVLTRQRRFVPDVLARRIGVAA